MGERAQQPANTDQMKHARTHACTPTLPKWKRIDIETKGPDKKATTVNIVHWIRIEKNGKREE